jgi:hypothetical protein
VSATKDAGFPVTQRDTSANAGGFTWPAFTTPGASRMCVAIFMGNGPTANALATLTSPNLTWTLKVAVVTGANDYRCEIWTAWAATAVTGEVITTTVSPNNGYNRRSFVVFSVAGSTSTGVGNSASNAAVTTNPSLAISASDAGAFLIAAVPYRSSGNDIAVDGNTTDEYSGGGGGGFGFNERAGSRASASGGSITLAWAGGDPPFETCCIAGVEITGLPTVISALVGEPITGSSLIA